MEKYLIGMMVISFFVDTLLLTGAGKLTGRKVYRFGLIIAGLVGAVYKALCVMPRFAALNQLLIRLPVMAVMSLLSFGMNRSAAYPLAVFLVLQMALMGLVSGAGMGNLWSALLSGGALWLLCFIACSHGKERIIPAELTHGGNTVKIRALVDSGNLLKDPVTGEAVLVVCNQLGAILAGLTEKQIADPVQTLLDAPNRGFRLLPYHTVGKSHGMMLAMKIDNVKLRGQKAGNLIAFAPCGLGMQKEYQALTGGI